VRKSTPNSQAASTRGPSPIAALTGRSRASTPGSIRAPSEPDINLDEVRMSVQQENLEALRRKQDQSSSADSKATRGDEPEKRSDIVSTDRHYFD
jgi:hypothetical protein